MYGSKGWLVPGRKPVSGKMPRIEAKDVVWLPFWFSCIPRPGGSGSSQKSLALVGGLVHVAGHDPPPSKGGSADWRGAKPRRSREPGVARPRHPHTSTIRRLSQHPLCLGIDRTAPTGRSIAPTWSQTAAGRTRCVASCRHPRRWGIPSAWTAGRARAARLSSSYSSRVPARLASWTAELCLARPR